MTVKTFASIVPAGREWQRDANCLEGDPDEMFVLGAAQNRVAYDKCLGCLVRLDCLADAMDNDIQFGVWGGMTERGRRQLRKKFPNITNWRQFLGQRAEAQTADQRRKEARELEARLKDNQHPSRLRGKR